MSRDILHTLNPTERKILDAIRSDPTLTDGPALAWVLRISKSEVNRSLQSLRLAGLIADDGTIGADEPDPSPEEQTAIARRARAVLAAKIALRRHHGDTGLPSEVLDQVLEPVACRRTRDRLSRRATP